MTREVIANPPSLSESPPLESQSPTSDLFQALFFALLGGLILNLMPCVFPILSLKALSLMAHLKQNNARSMKIHSLVYLLGVLISFWSLGIIILAFRSAGGKLGWGFQLQSPGFVSALASFLFVVGLNLLGVFEVETSLAGIGKSLLDRKGYVGTFFTGVLATVVATPCTAPFMGAAMAFALTQPTPILLSVFSALGVGLALPYCLLCWAPPLRKILPKPGRWMETFKQLMAFPIFGTVIWLAWVLGLETHNGVMTRLLVALLALAMGAWTLNRWPGPFSKRSFIVLLLAVFWLGQNGFSLSTLEQTSRVSTWENFSRDKLARLNSTGTPVFVDFTAAWCVTCQVNEKVALTPHVMAEMSHQGIVPLRADWTNSNPEITQTLAEFGRNGVPLYVLYSGKPGVSPQILPQLLTPQIVLDAIKRAGQETRPINR